MGRTVINETENKQTVILNDSPEGVEGGYFDDEMVWHELGGGDEPQALVTTERDLVVYNALNINQKAVSIDDDVNLLYKNNLSTTASQYGVRILLPLPLTDIDGAGHVSADAPVLFTLHAGDELTYDFSDYSMNGATGFYGSMVMRNGETSLSDTRFDLDGADHTVTITAEESVNNILIYVSKEVSDFAAKIRIYRNGDRLL